MKTVTVIINAMAAFAAFVGALYWYKASRTNLPRIDKSTGKPLGPISLLAVGEEIVVAAQFNRVDLNDATEGQRAGWREAEPALRAAVKDPTATITWHLGMNSLNQPCTVVSTVQGISPSDVADQRQGRK